MPSGTSRSGPNSRGATLRRVVVTGLGAVTPCGPSIDETWASVLALRSGIGPVSLFDASAFTCRVAGECRDYDPGRFIEKKRLREVGRFIQLGIGAAHMAVEQSGLLDEPDLNRERVATIVGVGMCGMEIVERATNTVRERGPKKLSPYVVPATIGNLAAGQVSMRYGFMGPSLCTTSACASGAHAVGEATRWIRHGMADAVVTGGAESTVTPVAMGGFASMRALTKRNEEPHSASRPFDVDRDGFVMSEGAASLVLEEYDHALRRGAQIHGEVIGYGASSDAHHLTQPAPEGRGAAKAMQLSLRDAGVTPQEVGYLNAHATSTPHGDRAELDAVRTVFGPGASVAVSSTKGVTGHLLGAAGALEAIFTVLALRDGIVPANANLVRPDKVASGLDLVMGEARTLAVQVGMSNAFGFGGTNVSLVFRKAEK